MLIDLHAHTSGISTCCRIPAHTVFETAKENGFDGLAITNHYTAYYFNDETHLEWINKYIDEWRLCREIGAQMNMKVFCGIEVTVDYNMNIHLLIYGADEDFLRQFLFLNKMPLEKLYTLCRSKGYALVQAHPFRNGTNVQDTRFLDGIEINCHPLYGTSMANDILKVATEQKLAVTCGCDYHADTYRPHGGVFIPDSVIDEKSLADYILLSREFSLQVHEPENKDIYTLTYIR